MNSGMEMVVSVTAEISLSGQRYRDDGGPEGEEKGISEARAQTFGDVAAIGQSGTKVALQETSEPLEIACNRRVVQAHAFTQVGEVFRGRRLAKDLLGHVAGQHHRATKNQNRGCKEQHDAQRDALGNEFEDRVHNYGRP
jgi:hypothetical protein